MDFFILGWDIGKNMKTNDKQDNLSRLEKMIVGFLKDEKVRVVLFGSRSRGDNKLYSDVDVGVIPYGKFDKSKITKLNEMIENSTIPYKVEIVNFNEVSKEFKKEVLKDALIWKD